MRDYDEDVDMEMNKENMMIMVMIMIMKMKKEVKERIKQLEGPQRIEGSLLLVTLHDFGNIP